MALASIEQLSYYLNQPIETTDDWAAASTALANASGAIRALVKSELDEVTTTAILLDGNASGSSTLVLPPPYPVTAVSSVEVLGTDNTTWTLLGYQTDYAWTAEGILERIMVASDIVNVPIRNWPARPQAIRVSYTHGFGTIPDGLVSICLSSAARQFTNPTGIIQERVESYMVRYAPNTHGIDFTPAEERVLGYYREVTVA